MSCFMAWNPVLPKLIDWSSLELGNVPLGAVPSSTTTVAGLLCVNSSCRCLLQGDLNLGLLETFQVPSPSIVLSHDVSRGPAFEVDFLPCLLGKNTELMNILNQSQAITLWRALLPISCFTLVSRPGPAFGKTRRGAHTHVPSPCCDLSSLARSSEATLTSFCFGLFWLLPSWPGL